MHDLTTPWMTAFIALGLLAACADERLPAEDTGARDSSVDDSGSADTGSTDAGRDTSSVDVGDSSMADEGIDAMDDAGVDAGDAGDSEDPANPGAFSVSTRAASVSRGGRTTPVVAYLPDGDGVHPLVVFVPGFQLSSAFYGPLCERLASHGFVVVRADPDDALLTVNHIAMRDDMGAVVDWALSAEGESARIDAAQVGAFGHSLGGKVTTMLALSDARVRALLGIDPVDGGMSLTMGPPPDIVPSQTSTLNIPVGFLGETTNSSGGFMPCAPGDQNFQRFFESTTMAPWAAEWDFEGADHMDFVHDTASCGFACGACDPGTADVPTVLASMSTLTVAFFRRHLQADAAMDTQLLTTPPAGTSVRSR